MTGYSWTKPAVVQRVTRGEGIKFKKVGWNVTLTPTEEPEPLEVCGWLFHEYAYSETSYNSLARVLTSGT